MRDDAREALNEGMLNYGNASSVHEGGRAARATIESARDAIAALVGAASENVVFNSGATEGNATVMAAFTARGPIIASAVEHPSILEWVQETDRIPVNGDGTVALDALESLCARHPRPVLVSTMLANNETGVIQPVADIVSIAARWNIPVHCDAVQAAGRIPVEIGRLGVDFLTLSAHKIGGGFGAGALILGHCAAPPVLLRGGGQEKGARAGTENVPAIAAFGIAARAAKESAVAYEGISALRDRLEKGLESLAPDTVFFGQEAPRLGNTTLFALPGMASRTALIHFDLEGIAVSNGSACSSGVVKTSHVLRAMGIGEPVAERALRVSLGWDSTESEIDAFLDSCQRLLRRAGVSRKQG